MFTLGYRKRLQARITCLEAERDSLRVQLRAMEQLKMQALLLMRRVTRLEAERR